MDWIKKNIPFVVSCFVALIAIGASGFYLFAAMGKYNAAGSELSTQDQRINGLVTKKPHPGAGDVNNIELIKQDIQRLVQFKSDLTKSFKAPPVKVQTEQDFKVELSDVMAQIERQGKRTGLTTPTNFHLSFTAQRVGFRFASNSLGTLSVQLADLREVTRILLAARVNSIEAYRRVGMSADDKGPNMAEGDYITNLKITTNEFTGAVVHPYEVVFRCFSEELGEVLEGIAQSPYSIMLKTLAVEPAEVRNIKPLFASAASVFGDNPFWVAPTTDQINARTAQPNTGPGAGRNAGRPGAGGRPDAAMNSRYGGGASTRPSAPATLPGTTPNPALLAEQAKPAGPETVLTEEPIKVTLGLSVVRMPEAPAAKPATN